MLDLRDLEDQDFYESNPPQKSANMKRKVTFNNKRFIAKVRILLCFRFRETKRILKRRINNSNSSTNESRRSPTNELYFYFDVN